MDKKPRCFLHGIPCSNFCGLSDDSKPSDKFLYKRLCPPLNSNKSQFKIDEKAILTDVSFSLPEGHSMAIVGPSGSGKTILARLIAQKLASTSGEISFSENTVVRMVEQQDNFMAISHIGSSYYGQRYENQGMDEAPVGSNFFAANGY